MIWTVVLEKTVESPLDCKEIQPVHPKGNQSWIFIGKVSEAGKDWRQEEKGWQRRRWLYIKPWDGYIYWMASPTQWTWIWASSGNWWWIGRAGVLQSWTWQRLNWTELISCILPSLKSHIYWPSPFPLLEQFLRAIWGAVSWAAVLILPQMKLNLQLSCCAFF